MKETANRPDGRKPIRINIRKRIMMAIAVLLFVCICFNAFADDVKPPKTADETNPDAIGQEMADRFSGQVHIGGLWMKSKSQLSPGDNNKRLDDFSQTPRSESEFIPLVFFNLNYELTNGNNIYMGIPFDGEPRLRFGIQHNTYGSGKLDLSFFYAFPEDVWEDPYLTGVDRIETDKNAYGGTLKYSLKHFEVSYALELVDVDKDDIGARIQRLSRDGRVHQFEIAYGIEIGSGFILKPGIGYVIANMDGDSNAYTEYSGGLSMLKMWETVALRTLVGGGTREYDTVHPIFNKTRKANTVEVMTALSWTDPLGFERFSLDIGGGYSNNDANITFYDSEGLFTFMTVGYRF